MYQYAVYAGYNEALTRTMTFVVLIAANIFLTLINRSFYYSILTTMKYKNNMVWMIILSTISIVGLILYLKPLTQLFQFERMTNPQLLMSVSIGFVVVVWFEIVKLTRRMKSRV